MWNPGYSFFFLAFLIHASFLFVKKALDDFKCPDIFISVGVIALRRLHSTHARADPGNTCFAKTGSAATVCCCFGYVKTNKCNGQEFFTN